MSTVRPQPAPQRVTIAVCMFERLTILATLDSLAAMQIPPGLEIDLIVADNNAVPLSRDPVVRHAARLGLPMRYLHVPACNISLARNRCLDEADSSSWLAFVDDDEVVARDWLVHAWAAAQTGVDVVFGPVEATYTGCHAPKWMIEGDFHSTGMGPRDPPDKGYSGNVLLRLNAVRDKGLRFDLRLGTIGGEDSDFFRRFHRAGARFTFAPGALVHEPVAAGRATLRWLCRRKFRTGQIHVLISAPGPNDRVRIGVAALLKCCWAALAALVALANRQRRAAHLQRAMFHAGVVAAVVGRDPIKGYG